MAAVLSQNSTIVRSKPSLPLSLRLSFGLGSVFAPAATARRALQLFTTPLSSSRRRARDEDAHGATVERIDVDGQSIATYTWGDPASQPIALFSHGWSSYGLRALPWIEPLQRLGYAVVAFDHVGHGRSDGRRATLPGFGATLAAVARRYPAIDVLIGHSLGGASVGLALAAGIRARHAVLIAPAADPHAAFARFGHMVGVSDAVLDDAGRLLVAEAQQDFGAMSAQHVAPRLNARALIVHDLEDADVPWEEGERYARYWPGARLLTTSGLGHRRILGEPTVIAAAMRFLRGADVGERVVSTDALPYGLA